VWCKSEQVTSANLTDTMGRWSPETARTTLIPMLGRIAASSVSDRPAAAGKTDPMRADARSPGESGRNFGAHRRYLTAQSIFALLQVILELAGPRELIQGLRESLISDCR
jgi:hypothetical protein